MSPAADTAVAARSSRGVGPGAGDPLAQLSQARPREGPTPLLGCGARDSASPRRRARWAGRGAEPQSPGSLGVAAPGAGQGGPCGDKGRGGADPQHCVERRRLPRRGRLPRVSGERGGTRGDAKVTGGSGRGAQGRGEKARKRGRQTDWETEPEEV